MADTGTAPSECTRELDDLQSWVRQSLRALLGTPSEDRPAIDIAVERRVGDGGVFVCSEPEAQTSEKKDGVTHRYNPSWHLDVPLRRDAEGVVRGRIDLVWKRHYDLTSIERDLVKGWCTETVRLMDLAPDLHSFVRSSHMDRIVPRVVARALLEEIDDDAVGENRLTDTLETALAFVKGCAQSTYEGTRLQLTVSVNGRPAAPGRRLARLDDYADRDARPWAVLLGSSADTVLRVSGDGYVGGLEAAAPRPEWRPENGRDESPTAMPVPLSSPAAAAQADPGVAVVTCLQGGSLLVTCGGTLLFSFRAGAWTFHSQDLFAVQWSGVNQKHGVKRAVLESLVDASFAGHGACVAVIRDGALHRRQDQSLEDFERRVTDERHSCWDRLRKILPAPTTDPASGERRSVLWGSLAAFLDEGVDEDIRARLFKRPNAEIVYFQELSRAQRLELLTVDGATLVCGFTGEVLGVGVIVQDIAAVTGGGGRSAAAQTLAQHGTCFKVSQDGPITMWRKETRERAGRYAPIQARAPKVGTFGAA